MTMLLFIVLLLFACALLCELFQRRLEETLPLAASAMTLLLLVFALAGALRAGATAVLALCALCLPASLVLAAKRGRLKALFNRLFTPAALIYLLLCATVILANTGKPVQTWDEFTYWADAVKVMSLNGTLPTAQAARSLYASYPPALPLWEFLPQRLNELLGGSFDEPLLFMSYQCLMFAFFMPFLHNVRLRRPLEWLACTVSVPLCVLVAFPTGLNMLHSDMMLGIMGGFVCAWPLLSSPRSRFSLATQCAAVSMLVLIKDAGLLYALAGVLAVFSMLTGRWRRLPCAWMRKGGYAKPVAAGLRPARPHGVESPCSRDRRTGAGNVLKPHQPEPSAFPGGRVAQNHPAQLPLSFLPIHRYSGRHEYHHRLFCLLRAVGRKLCSAVRSDAKNRRGKAAAQHCVAGVLNDGCLHNRHGNNLCFQVLRG